MTNQYSVKFEPNVPLMLRDGTITYADVYRPDTPGKVPALLKRTPYNKSDPNTRSGGVDAIGAAMHGYAVVIQDVRGRFSSDGEFYAFVDEMNDGYDSVEWVAAQSWCDGKVGMFGRSYLGATQWLAAKARPPSLMAIAPGITPSDYHEGWAWQGGAFQLGFNLAWSLGPMAAANWENLAKRLFLSTRQLEILIEAKDNLTAGLNHLPMQEFPELEGGLAPYYYDWLEHAEHDEYWENLSIEGAHSEISVPAFNYGGWYDIFLGGTLRNYVGMKENGATAEARTGQRLVVGPWSHGTDLGGVAGEVSFGTRAAGQAMGIQAEILRYHDYWLRGEDAGVSDEKPVRIFVMGENVWREEDEWPLDRAQYTEYYLHSRGKANTLNGDGWLTRETPGREAPDVYVYNPIDPVPTRGGPLAADDGFLPPGAFDQRPVEVRSDVLVYTTPRLEQYVEVTGPIAVTLFASTSGRDTDFTAKLVDVAPDGYARNLTEGIIRARFRTPKGPAELVDPGVVNEYKIDLWATSNLFKIGHRIRLEISSSNFPRFDRNANTGEPIGTDVSLSPALQTVYHAAEYPSRITLPVVPRD